MKLTAMQSGVKCIYSVFFFPTAKTHKGHKSGSRSQNFLKKYSHSQDYLAPNTVLSSLTR